MIRVGCTCAKCIPFVALDRQIAADRMAEAFAMARGARAQVTR